MSVELVQTKSYTKHETNVQDNTKFTIPDIKVDI